MEITRLPKTLSHRGGGHVLIRPHELWGSDELKVFRSRHEARHFFLQFERDSMEQRALQDYYLRAIPSANYSVATGGFGSFTKFLNILADAVYERRILLVKPCPEAWKRHMMPLARRQRRDRGLLPLSALPQSRKVRFINPRWEHNDEMLQEQRAAICQPRDRITLTVNVENLPPNGELDMNVIDLSKENEYELDSIRERNRDGLVTVEWEVIDPRSSMEDHEVKLAFEAHCDGVHSGRCDIPFMEKRKQYYFSM